MSAGEDRSLAQIEDDDWGEPSPASTRLVATAHRLRRRPIRDLRAEDLRLLISQHVGIDVLLPRAVTLLEHDPLTEGDFYPGDVLVAVVKVPPSYWRANPDQYERVRQVITRLAPDAPGLDGVIGSFLGRSG